MRTPTTIRIAASPATGTQDIKVPSTRKAASDSTPSMTPENRVTPPLDMLTSVAPIWPAPGMPPQMAEVTLPRPWPISSRLESWREWVSASSTMQVFSVSMDSSTASVSAGTAMYLIWARPMSPAACKRALMTSVKLPPPPRLSAPTTKRLPSSVSRAGSASPHRK